MWGERKTKMQRSVTRYPFATFHSTMPKFKLQIASLSKLFQIMIFKLCEAWFVVDTCRNQWMKQKWNLSLRIIKALPSSEISS